MFTNSTIPAFDLLQIVKRSTYKSDMPSHYHIVDDFGYIMINFEQFKRDLDVAFDEYQKELDLLSV